MSKAIEQGDECFVVALIDGVVVGFGSIVPELEELRAVYVDPVFGGRGVGSAILSRLEEVAFELGLSTLRMDASINAEGFYSHRGYASERRSVHRLSGGMDMECVTMCKPIARRKSTDGGGADDR